MSIIVKEWKQITFYRYLPNILCVNQVPILVKSIIADYGIWEIGAAVQSEYRSNWLSGYLPFNLQNAL